MTLELPTGLPWVALDTETSGLHPDDGARVACVALAHKDWSVGLPFDQGVRDKFPTAQISLDLFGNDADPNLPYEDWLYLLRWCGDQKLVFQNAKFDLMMMRAGTRHWPGEELIDAFHWDTMLAQGVLDPKELRGLDATAERLGIGAKKGLGELKGWLKRHGYKPERYDLAPWDIVEEYVVTDAEMTADIYEHETVRLESKHELRGRIRRSFELMRALYMMEKRGLPFDDVTCLEEAEKIEARANEVEATMPFVCKPNAAHDYFFRQLKLTADRVSEKTGRPSLDEEQVRKWIGEGVPWASEYALVSKYRRAVSMWYRGYPEKIGTDGRLRCSFRQGHVKSGRMSVERLQLQAVPKKDKNLEGIIGIREMIRAPEGFGLWNLDLSQAELRVATHYSRCRRMAEQLAKGEDIHSNTTKQIIKVDGVPIDEDHPLWKEKRDIAKRLTFGGIFQIGWQTFQSTLSKLADIHMPDNECKAIVAAWRQMYPEFGTAYNRADRKAQQDGYVRLLPNTQYEVWSYFREHEFTNTAWNRMVQGSLAEAFGMWLAEIEKRWPGYLVLTVHDSVVLLAPLDEGDSLATGVAELGATMMTDVFGTPMRVDVDRW